MREVPHSDAEVLRSDAEVETGEIRRGSGKECQQVGPEYAQEEGVAAERALGGAREEAT